MLTCSNFCDVILENSYYDDDEDVKSFYASIHML